MPAAKLLNELCSARPIAKPAAPTAASKVLVCTPNELSALISTNKNRKTLSAVIASSAISGSMCSRSAMRSVRRATQDSASDAKTPNTTTLIRAVAIRATSAPTNVSQNSSMTHLTLIVE